MAHGDQWEVWNPFEAPIGLTETQRVSKERGEAWAMYSRGGGGDPSYFDYETWIKGRDHQSENEQERKRLSQRR